MPEMNERNLVDVFLVSGKKLPVPVVVVEDEEDRVALLHDQTTGKDSQIALAELADARVDTRARCVP
jgi:hypothetical protein